MHDDDDDFHHTPEEPRRQTLQAARRAIVLEESLRAATAFMAVVFSVSVIASFPFVPAWVFPAALGGVMLSVPAAVYVRMRCLDPTEPRSPSALWGSALVGVGTFALLGALLVALARVTDLGTALSRFGGVVLAFAVIARLRGWRPLAPLPVQPRMNPERQDES